MPFLTPSQGLLPARAGSPLAGRVSHPLDDGQSFMKVSPPPIPFDQPCLVALLFFSPHILVKPRDVLLDKRPLAPRRFVDHPIDRCQARCEIASDIGSELGQDLRFSN